MWPNIALSQLPSNLWIEQSLTMMSTTTVLGPFHECELLTQFWSKTAA